MKRFLDDDTRSLRMLDLYLSVQADRVFESAAPRDDRGPGRHQANSQGLRRGATATILVAVLSVAFAMLGASRTDPVNVSTLRGEP